MPGSPMAWRSSGSAGAPPAVFIHGLGGSRLSWEPQLDGLADVRQCLACDLPGYGESEGLPGSLPELASLAADWIASLGRGPADVVGLSFGGMVAQHLALNHPAAVRTLALLDTSPAFGFDGVTTPEEWLATRVSPAPDAVATLVMVGAEDHETPESYARAIAERIPGARLVVVPGAGHLLNVEAPGAVNDELRRLWLPDAEVRG